TDNNGNWMSLGGLWNGGATPNPVTDTLGRVLPLNTGTTTTDYSGCVSSLAMAAAYLMNYSAPDGSTHAIKLCYASIPMQTAFSQYGVAQYPSAGNGQSSTPPWQLVTVVLADGRKWTFSYDSYGEVTSIGLPTGGSISYA